MGKKVKKPDKTDTRQELTINLFGPGMTALHKVGLAGLWMTLKALEKENGGKPSFAGVGGTWELTDTSVTLRWDGKPGPFFNTLFEKSFRTDKNGLIWFPALGAPIANPQHAVILQDSILGSFLQHGQTRNADKGNDPKGVVSVTIDETPFALRFRKITSYAHQTSEFNPLGTNTLAGWLFPGGAVRHTGLQSSTALEEPPDKALVLHFAPVGAIYFEIKSRGGGVRPRYSLVIAEIRNLKKYSEARQCFLPYGVKQLYAAGTAEAGYRVLAELKAANLLEDISSAFCRVISFGTVPWSSQQKSRVNLMTVQATSESDLKVFDFCQNVLFPQLIKRDDKEPFWDVPQVPDIVARNLSQGKQWWEGFGDFISDKEVRDHVFGYVRDSKGKLIYIKEGEKGGLVKMVENHETFPEGPETTFVLACHEAWRRRMGKISGKTQREGSSFGDQVSREFERLRVSFSRCKNAASLREAVTDFWARGGGPLKPLQEGWKDILTLMNEKNWRKSKDLALLALASYKSATKDEAVALGEHEPSEIEGEE